MRQEGQHIYIIITQDTKKYDRPIMIQIHNYKV